VGGAQWVFWLIWGFFNFMSQKCKQKLVLYKNKVKTFHIQVIAYVI
jgi:hypothetical protein